MATLGDRMKGYENVSQSVLMKRTPVIIRVDGRAFHTFTKQYLLDRTPFSQIMTHCMAAAAMSLVHQIQGAVLAYAQSDEISVLVRDWDNFNTEQWFGGKIQKMVSISSAIASVAFYAAYEKLTDPIDYAPHRPLFDSRAFNVPREDVDNYFIWRQKDAIRNSVNMLGQYHFSHKELQGKNVDQVKQMLEEKGVSWDKLSTVNKRGFCVPAKYPLSSAGPRPDFDIPEFVTDREYILRWIND